MGESLFELLLLVSLIAKFLFSNGLLLVIVGHTGRYECVLGKKKGERKPLTSCLFFKQNARFSNHPLVSRLPINQAWLLLLCIIAVHVPILPYPSLPSLCIEQPIYHGIPCIRILFLCSFSITEIAHNNALHRKGFILV